MSYKIGIIGAARRHQGTGPFIARTFAQLGHEVCGIVGTSSESASEAISHLSDQYGIITQYYTSFEELIQQQTLDMVVISSPPDSHLSYLEKALASSHHVFCEKPLWWPEAGQHELDQSAYLQTIQKIIDLAKQNQRYLHLNTQWPYTLRDFSCLYPSAMTNPITQFAMYLSPQNQGISMLVDAASHGLSMLYQLVGTGELNNIQVQRTADKALINFDYLHQQGCTKTTLGFLQSNETPKPASYQINGFTVKRTVSLPEYQIQLQSDQQTLMIQDPLDASIRDFLASVDAGLESDETALLLGAHHLYQLIEHYK